MKAALGFIFFMLFLAGIAFVSLKGMRQSTNSQVQGAAELTGSAWRLIRLGEMRLPDGNGATVQFSDDRVTGNGGCNDYFGDYELAESILKIGPIGATRKSCPEPVMALEISFMDSLNAATSVKKMGTRLSLFDANDRVLCQFVATEIAQKVD